MNNFVKLGEIADLSVGFIGTMAKHYIEEGVPFLRSLNIKPYDISGGDLKYISLDFIYYNFILVIILLYI